MCLARSSRYWPASLLPALLALGLALGSCEGFYGKVGGADETVSTQDRARIDELIGPWSGIWFSHYGGRKLDSYRVGQWKDRRALLPPEKLALFPGLDLDAPQFCNSDGSLRPAVINDTDYFVFYDGTVYEKVPGDGGNGGFAGLGAGFIGIVRAVNLFNGSDSAGAVIIEYLAGCYSTWDPDIFPGPPPLPFFGIYFRVLNPNCIQMANAVELEHLSAGQKYYTETATLEQAIAKNNADNDGEFIAWGVVIPQDREE
jgi:hypothetical protein